jgi:uncharacterized membrane-anchored protein
MTRYEHLEEERQRAYMAYSAALIAGEAGDVVEALRLDYQEAADRIGSASIQNLEKEDE